MSYQQMGFLPTQKRLIKCETGQCQRMPRSNIHSWVWHPITTSLSPNFAGIAKCLHQLIGPTNLKKTKAKKGKERSNFIRWEKIGVDSTCICLGIWTSKGFWCTKSSFNYSPSTGIPQFQHRIYPGNRYFPKRSGSCFVPNRWKW